MVVVVVVVVVVAGGYIGVTLSLSLSRCSSRAAVVFLNGCATFGYCGFKFFSWILHVGYVFVGVVGHVIINFTFTFISIFLLVNRFIVCLFFFSFHCLFFLVLFLLPPPPPLPVERERELRTLLIKD